MAFPTSSAQNVTGDDTEAFYSTVRSASNIFKDVLINVKPLREVVGVFVLVSIGIITNVMNQFVFARFKINSSIVYMRVLALSDLIACLSLYGGYYYTLSKHSYSLVFVHVVNIGKCLNYISVGTSTVLAVAISVERFIITSFPTHARLMTSTTKASIISLAMFILSAIARSPLCYAIYHIKTMVDVEGTPVYFAHQEFTPLIRSLMNVITIIYDYIPTILLLICNIGIIVNLLRSRRIRKDLISGSSHDEGNQRENRLIVCLVVICCLTFVANAPITLLRIIPMPRSVLMSMAYFTEMAYIFNNVVNFVVYLVFLKEFRVHLKKMFSSKMKLYKSEDSENTGTTAIERKST